MANGLDFYVNLLAGSMSGLSAVSAMKSLDDSAAKATDGIKSLEGQVEQAKAKLASLKDDGKVNELAADLTRAKDQLAAIKSGKVAFDPAQYKQASDAVGKFGAQLENAKAKQSAAVDAQKSKVEALTGKLQGAKDAYTSNANLVAAKRALMQKSLDEQVAGLGNILTKAKEAGGPVGSLAGKLEGLGKGGVAGAVVAIVAAIGAMAVALGYAAVKATAYAFSMADAARSSRLMSEAALGSAAAGNELEAVVDQMSNLAPGLSKKLKEVGRELADVEIKGRDAQRVLNTFGIIAGAGRNGEQVKQIAEASRLAGRLILGARDRFGEFASLKGTGVKAADIYAAVARSMRTSIPEAERAVKSGLIPFKKGMEALELAAQTKLGGVVAKQMISLSTQVEKLRENVAKLFSGVNIEKFLEGLKTVTDLFDANTVTGYVLREVFTAVFTKIAELAAKVFPYVKAAIQGVVMGILLTVTIAKQLHQQFQQTFGGVGKNIDGIMLAFKAGVGVVGLFVGSIVALTAAFAMLGVVALLALAPIWIPVAITTALIYGIVKAIMAVVDEAKSLGKEIAGIDLAGAAGKMIDGLINGIKSKIADVKSAVLEVSGAITGAFNSDQEIRSPGRKAMRQSKHVVEGHAIGLVRNAGIAERASMAVSGAVSRGIESSGNSSGNTSAPRDERPTFAFNNCNFGAVTQATIEEMMAMAYLKMQRGFAEQS